MRLMSLTPQRIEEIEMENQVTRLKERVAVLRDADHAEADHICFMHLKDACDDFGASGRVAKKLLDLVEELLQ